VQAENNSQPLKTYIDGRGKNKPHDRLFYNLIGRAPGFLRMLDDARAAAKSDSSVLITGEYGTGKRILAQTIHYESSRGFGSFRSIECKTAAADFFNNEIFGFNTEATWGEPSPADGGFEIVNHGSVYLDEIGNLSDENQLALLRILVKVAYTSMDSPRSIAFDTRIISATENDVNTMADDERFHRELLHRLSVITISTVPLRQRREDIGELALSFLEKIAMRRGRPYLPLRADVLKRLHDYDWPGNISELFHVLDLAVADAPKGIIRAESLVLDADAWEKRRNEDA
jgi:DNA-binding NtrC family response regulator